MNRRRFATTIAKLAALPFAAPFVGLLRRAKGRDRDGYVPDLRLFREFNVDMTAGDKVVGTVRFGIEVRKNGPRIRTVLWQRCPKYDGWKKIGAAWHGSAD